ncbi:MAG: SAM-dependent methyltransferase [Thermoprotei archaeon]
MSWKSGSEDKYYRRARREGYRSRSALKLQEILRTKKPKQGDRVLDLGCSPGGWSQVLSSIVGPKGSVTGVDIVDPRIKLSNFNFLRRDIRDQVPEVGPFSWIFCDAAPKFTGIRDVDMARAQELWQACLNWCDKTLTEDGNLVMKVFQSRELDEIRPEVEGRFNHVKFVKPKASRKESPEIYLLCEGFRTSSKINAGSSSPASNLMP